MFNYRNFIFYPTTRLCAIGEWVMFYSSLKTGFAFIAPKNIVSLHSPKDCAIDELVQRASVLTRTIAVCWNYYFVQNQSAKQRAGSACPDKGGGPRKGNLPFCQL